MASKVALTLLSLLGAAVAYPDWHQDGANLKVEEPRYQGPPAPLNEDGTVAFTPELQEANAAHKAAFTGELHKLKTADIGISVDDFASLAYYPYDKGARNSHQEGDYKAYLYGDDGYSPQQYDGAQYKRYGFIEEQDSKQYYEGLYNPKHYDLDQYDQNQ